MPISWVNIHSVAALRSSSSTTIDTCVVCLCLVTTLRSTGHFFFLYAQKLRFHILIPSPHCSFVLIASCCQTHFFEHRAANFNCVSICSVTCTCCVAALPQITSAMLRRRMIHFNQINDVFWNGFKITPPQRALASSCQAEYLHVHI